MRYFKITRYIATFIFAIILINCSPTKQLQSLQKYHPELFKMDSSTTITVDTIYHHAVRDSLHLRFDTTEIQKIFNEAKASKTTDLDAIKRWIINYIQNQKVIADTAYFTHQSGLKIKAYQRGKQLIIETIGNPTIKEKEKTVVTNTVTEMPWINKIVLVLLSVLVFLFIIATILIIKRICF